MYLYEFYRRATFSAVHNLFEDKKNPIFDVLYDTSSEAKYVANIIV